MAEPQPSKLVMRVRFPSPAPSRFSSSGYLSQVGAMERASRRASVGPRMGHRSRGSWVPGLVSRVGLGLAGEPAERLGDHLIAVPGGMLVDHRGAGAGMPKAGHQFFDRRARRGGERAARMSQVMEVQARRASARAGRVPYGPEVGPAQRRTLGPDENQAPAAGQSEAVKMPAKLGHEFGREGHGAPAGAGFGSLGAQAARVEFCRGFDDPDFAAVEVDVFAAQRDQFTPAQAGERSQEHERPVPDRDDAGDRENDRQRDDLALV